MTAFIDKLFSGDADTKPLTVFVAGHQGMVGSAVIRRISQHASLVPVTATRTEVDLRVHDQVQSFFLDHRIDVVVLAAAKVGGIHANNEYPADFIYDNLMIEANVIHASHLAGVQRLLFLGSSCIYPKLAAQPMNEDCLLTGMLEPTNEPYAVAKIAGIKLCESYNRQFGRDYRSLMPTNLYGPGDNFHSQNSHVIPALISKFHDAAVSDKSEVVVWGSGTARREFLHVDDLADACIHALNLPTVEYWSQARPMMSHLNVGTGLDCSIRELAEMIAEITGFRGAITFDSTKPDGAPKKLLNTSKLSALGWKFKIPLRDGLSETYDWFKSNYAILRH